MEQPVRMVELSAMQLTMDAGERLEPHQVPGCAPRLCADVDQHCVQMWTEVVGRCGPRSVVKYEARSCANRRFGTFDFRLFKVLFFLWVGTTSRKMVRKNMILSTVFRRRLVKVVGRGVVTAQQQPQMSNACRKGTGRTAAHTRHSFM